MSHPSMKIWISLDLEGVAGRMANLDPEVFATATLDGREVGESGINALVAEHYGVPIALVTGDQVTWAETEPYAGGALPVITKESITRGAANGLHPDESF
jgi:D-amino peptidase